MNPDVLNQEELNPSIRDHIMSNIKSSEIVTNEMLVNDGRAEVSEVIDIPEETPAEVQAVEEFTETATDSIEIEESEEIEGE